jgi:hypothetical protein
VFCNCGLHTGSSSMTNPAQALYRRLDREHAEAHACDSGDDGQPELVRPRRWRQGSTVSGSRRNGPRVLLVKLTQKKSAKGMVYLSGWMGTARLVAFVSDEQDRDGNQVQVWNVYATEPQPRGDRA